MWFAFMRKFSQVRGQHMLILLGLCWWRNQPVILLLPLPFMFSVKVHFFSFLFSLFFLEFQLYMAALPVVLHTSWLWKQTLSNFRVWWLRGSLQGKQHDLSHPMLGCRGRRTSPWNPLFNEAFPDGAHLLSSFPWHSHFPHCGLPKGKNGPSFSRQNSVEGSIQCENVKTVVPNICDFLHTQTLRGFLLGFTV